MVRWLFIKCWKRIKIFDKVILESFWFNFLGEVVFEYGYILELFWGFLEKYIVWVLEFIDFYLIGLGWSLGIGIF